MRDKVFIEYIITVTNATVQGSLVMTSGAEYLGANLGIAADIMLKYGNNTSCIMVKTVNRKFTDKELQQLEDEDDDFDTNAGDAEW